MSIKPLTTSQKICTSLRETFSDRSRAAVVGAIAVGAIVSPSFRTGVLTSPLGMVSSLAIQMFGSTVLPKKFPSLPEKIRAIGEKIFHFSMEISPRSEAGPVLLWPLIEEGMFRGILQPLLVSKVGTSAGIALSTLAFASVHYEQDNPNQVLSSLVGGVVLGVLSEKVSLLASLGHHVGVNAFWFIGIDHLMRNYHSAEYIEKRRTS